MGNESRRNFRLVCSEQRASLVEALLRAEGFAFEREPFSPSARVLTGEPSPLGTSAAARFGRVYIQDRSSMLPALALNPPAGASVLDMCAAPGSKTGLLARLAGPQGFVLGCEPSTGRIATLRANLRRAGAVQAVTLHRASERLDFGGPAFAHVLLDPPCSGWGTEDKNPRARGLWSGEKVEPLLRLQRTLLERAAELLLPGGKMVYSTCTTNEDENEAQVLRALETLGLELEPLPAPPGFVFDEPRLGCPAGVLRVAEESEGEGFFVAALRKPEADSQGDLAERRGAGAPSGGRRLRAERLRGPQGLDWAGLPPGELCEFAGKVVFLHAEALRLIGAGMRWQGATLGKLNKDVFRPDPFCRALMPSEPGEGALDVQDADEIVGLMSGRALASPPGDGPVPLYFRGLRLGWAARKGKRVLWTES
jgi:16S rRNA (cytosine1407-C5)-methyltransferase